ncbi:hypothetical protein [Phenylobacterium sp.]|jgi:hypothetical protein|uniref:hypothetical protein n=1 Tax=Phenylobacterium sp. TaxID=1871053 RepID=UPI002F3E67A3
MATTPNSIITPQLPKSLAAVCTTANTTYTDTPTNTQGLASAGVNGSRVTRVTAIPRATITATQLQLYRSVDAGVTKRFFRSALMPAYTMAQTTEAPIVDFGYTEENPLILIAGEIIYCAIGVTPASSGTIGFCAEWADY